MRMMSGMRVSVSLARVALGAVVVKPLFTVTKMLTLLLCTVLTACMMLNLLVCGVWNLNLVLRDVRNLLVGCLRTFTAWLFRMPSRLCIG